MNVDEFWNKSLLETGKDKNLRYIEAFHFEETEELANELLNLVLKGQKRATASSLLYYQITGEEQPKSGDYSIVTDWNGTPKCIIQTTNVTILPFKDITFDICVREGEDDCLESWQRGHRHYFTAQGRECGYEFSEDMPVVFEDFKVVYPIIK